MNGYANDDAYGTADSEVEPEWMLGLQEPPDEESAPPADVPAPASLAAVASVASLPSDPPVTSDAPRRWDPIKATDPSRVEGAKVLADVREWLARFVSTMTPGDLDLLALWAVHTHVAPECYTSPRLQLDSPMPGSGKTTVLDHLSRLCHNPVQMAAISSSALLARLLAVDTRTLLIDEVDRTLDPKRDGSADVIAILNSGYRVGATRPVLEPRKGGGWDAVEMPVFAPVAMAGNNPALPDDTRSRVLRVVLLPDLEGKVEESDWELIEGDALELHDRIVRWAFGAKDLVRTLRPPMPEGVIGRNREKWGPLARIAHLVGGRWPAAVDEMALHHLREQEQDREDGLVRESPAVLLLRHVSALWPEGEAFAATEYLTAELATRHPDQWGVTSSFGKPLNAHRFGRMLSQAYKVHSRQITRGGRRGYTLADLLPAMHRMGVRQPPRSDASDGSDASDASGPVQTFLATA
jgi:hypothetical protein